MSPSDRHTVVHIPKIAWLGLGILLVAPWLVLFWVMRGAPAAAPAPVRRAAAAATAPTAGVTRVAPGPWGDLEYSRILIEPPEDLIVADYTRVDELRWVFKGYAETALTALWRDAGLDGVQQQALNDPARRETTPDAIVVKPTREFVIALSPAARAKIYGALAAFPENQPQFNPYRLREDAADQWFDDSGLSPETVALTKKMFYRRGTDAVFFSDDDVVLPLLADAGERVKFIKTLSRKSALFVQLRVRPGQDIEAMARYWGRGRRSKDLRPLLQSLARLPGGGTLDIAHLLPPFARALIYTYPLPSGLPGGDLTHDCHWTSFNFFNDQPDERFIDINVVRQTLLNDYYPVPGAATYGDILMFVRADGVVVHSCIYLAGDLVFTKNGPAFSVPWMVAPLDSVKALYSLTGPVDVRRYRSKNL